MFFPKCPLCKQYAERLIHIFTGEGEEAVLARIRSRYPSWSIYQGMCERCLYVNEFDSADNRFLPDPGLAGNVPSALRSSLFRARVKNPFAVLPIPLRLNADPRFRGKGVTIAFIDSGFYPHPDLVRPRNRIREIVDVTDQKQPRRYFREPHAESWHGTMTAVTAAGSGTLSHGLYRGIASEADVVLIKVMNTKKRRISRQDIVRALEWVMEHAEEHAIRIISMSVYDDEPGPADDNPVNRAVEKAVEKGIVVVAASGNTPHHPLFPPANAPSAITVGGVDDRNELSNEARRLFHSTYGKMPDGSTKPDVIAPAIWIAGPILPHTDQFREAPVLFRLLAAKPGMAERILRQHRRDLTKVPKKLDKHTCHAWARKRIAEMQYVAPFYKHVDGTSFAAPIVSAVIAQMLEAHPLLTPADVKKIVMETAEPLKNAAQEQQGRGVLSPRAAVLAALRQLHTDLQPGAHTVDGRVLFIYHNRVPRRVAVAGSFNNWDTQSLHLQESHDGWWSAWMPKPRAGVHQYKYVVDDSVWMEDPANKDKVPDGFGGWNSRLAVEERN
jgi:serine protease AprX